jgi:hypothetical protein
VRLQPMTPHLKVPQAAAQARQYEGAGIAAGSFSCRKEHRGPPVGGAAYAGSMESSMRLPQGSSTYTE